MSAFTENLAWLLKERRIKKIDLARETGIPQSSITRYASGERKPTVEHLFSICHFLKVDKEWMMTGEGEMSAGKTEESIGRTGLAREDNLKYSEQPSEMNKFVQLFKEGTGMLTIGDKIGYIRKCGDSLDEEDLLRTQMGFEDGVNSIIKRILERQNSLKKNIAG